MGYASRLGYQRMKLINVNAIKEQTKELSLLLVEDDKAFSHELQIILNDLFNVVVVASDGEDGLKKYNDYYDSHKKYIDILLTDLHMPNMNGAELSEKILKIHHSQEIIIISADCSLKLYANLINKGIHQLIIKPIQEEQLFSILNRTAQNINNKLKLNEYYDKVESLNFYLEDAVKQATNELKNKLYIDNLTGLKSRYALTEKLEKKQQRILIVVDIDKFGAYNELFGVEIGNQIIIKFANALKKFIKKESTKLYRISGDQFAILCDYSEYTTQTVESLVLELSKYVYDLILYIEMIDEYIDIECTIGLVISDANLLEKGYTALRHAKKENLNYFIFHEDIDSSVFLKNMLTWKHTIKEAIEQDRVMIMFQPIFDKSKNLIKYESLMRIKNTINEEEKYISPNLFLDNPASKKQYATLSLIVVKKVLAKLLEIETISLSLNLSFIDIKNQKIEHYIENFLAKNCVGDRLIFEILESDTIEDYQILTNFVDKFRKYGVKIAIDDFGSGYSNFQQIMKIAPDYIKIDGSIIKEILVDEKMHLLVEVITNMAHIMNIQVIGEFVHTQEIFYELIKIGVDEFQGYYLGEPKHL